MTTTHLAAFYISLQQAIKLKQLFNQTRMKEQVQQQPQFNENCLHKNRAQSTKKDDFTQVIGVRPHFQSFIYHTIL